nr:mannose/glucose-specific lectin-like [Coffea arabica]
MVYYLYDINISIYVAMHYLLVIITTSFLFLRVCGSGTIIFVWTVGGPGGSPWSYIATDGIKEITLDVGRNIRAISFADAKGFISGTFGGNNPNNIGKEEKITIQWPSEYLTSITGTYGDFNGLLVIYSLSFVTNQKAYGPFGSPSSGQAFSSPPDGNVIVGFHGRSGWYIDAIGIYVQPAPTTSLGPWGGPVGNPWSYIPTDGIKEIIMDVGRNIRAISFADANGFISGKFGGKDPNNIGKEEKITIQWPSEYLTSIKGTFGNFNGDVVIYSLSFITNNKHMDLSGAPTVVRLSLLVPQPVMLLLYSMECLAGSLMLLVYMCDRGSRQSEGSKLTCYASLHEGYKQSDDGNKFEIKTTFVGLRQK